MIDLGTLGGDYSFAYGINNQSQVVGHSQGGLSGETRLFNNHAFLWSETSSPALTDLGNLGVDGVFARAINENGVVVGFANKTIGTTTPVLHERGFRYTTGGGIEELPLPSGSVEDMRALGIAQNETIVGSVEVTVNNALVTRAFVLPFGATEPTVTNALDGDLGILLRDANSVAGKAVGFGSLANNQSRAIMVRLTDPATPIELANLGGQQAQAYAINDVNQIAGFAWNATNTKVNAVVFQPENSSTPIIDLGHFGERFNTSVAYDININGDVVGTAQTALSGQTQSAFLYELNASSPTLKNLNNLIDCSADVTQRWNLISAQAINDSGEIVGYGTKGNLTRAFLLRPSSDTTPPLACPEPPPFEDKNEAGSISGYALLLALPMLFWRRRKN